MSNQDNPQPDHIPDDGKMVQQPVSAALMSECITPDMYAHSPTLQAAYKWGFAQALAQAGVPDGWMLVPKEPTSEMVRSGLDEYYHPETPDCDAIYKAMLAAAPVSAKEGFDEQ